MEVRPLRGHETELAGQGGQGTNLVTLRVTARDHLDPPPTESHEFRTETTQDQPAQAIAGRVGDDGDASCGPDPSDDLVETGPFTGGIPRFPPAQIATKGRLEILRQTLFDEFPGKMGATDDRAAGRLTDRPRKGILETDPLEAPGHRLGATQAPFTEIGQSGLQHRRRRIDAQAEDVEQPPPPGHADLDAGNELDALPAGLDRGFVETGRRIVIGQGQDVDPSTPRPDHQIRGREEAIGGPRMAVQVVDDGSVAPGQRAGVMDFCHGLLLPLFIGRTYADARPPSARGVPRAMKLLFELLPILTFFVAYRLYDIYVATAAAIVVAVAQAVAGRLRRGRWETVQLVTLALIVVFGGATLLLQDEVYIKWKPTVLNGLFAIAFLASQFIGEKNLAERMMGGQIRLPPSLWTRVNLFWVAFFVFCGLANWFVMSRYDTETWVDFKLFGLLGLTLTFIVALSLYLTRHLAPVADDDRPKG